MRLVDFLLFALLGAPACQSNEPTHPADTRNGGSLPDTGTIANPGGPDAMMIGPDGGGSSVNSGGPDATMLGPDGAVIPPGTHAGALAVGPFSSCVIDAQSNVYCFGRCGPMGQGGARDMAPAGLKAQEVAVGRAFACALLSQTQNGSIVRCWGGGAAAVAPNITDAVEIVAGDDHACVRTQAGAVTCWGGMGQVAPPGLAAKALAASGAMTCAIAADDTVTCFGPRPAIPPAGLKAKRIAVSSQLTDPLNGPRYGCAVAMTDEVLCWGDDSGGVQTVPMGLKARNIAVGRSSACAIGLDDTVTCWGSPPRFGGMLPAGLKAKALSMRFRTAGAIQVDGSFVFWGDVTDGRGQPPAGVRAGP